MPWCHRRVQFAEVGEHTGGVASKYDSYWAGRLGEIRAAVERAAAGLPAVVELPGLCSMGERQSWSGVAEVRGRGVIRGSMAHATSLGRAVAASGICAAWPGSTFRLTIAAAGDVLRVSAAKGGPVQPAGATAMPPGPVPARSAAGAFRRQRAGWLSVTAMVLWLMPLVGVVVVGDSGLPSNRVGGISRTGAGSSGLSWADGTQRPESVAIRHVSMAQTPSRTAFRWQRTHFDVSGQRQAASAGRRVRHVATPAFPGPDGTGTVTARVQPEVAHPGDLLASTDGAANAVVCQASPIAEVTITGASHRTATRRPGGAQRRHRGRDGRQRTHNPRPWLRQGGRGHQQTAVAWPPPALTGTTEHCQPCGTRARPARRSSSSGATLTAGPTDGPPSRTADIECRVTRGLSPSVTDNE